MRRSGMAVLVALVALAGVAAGVVGPRFRGGRHERSLRREVAAAGIAAAGAAEPPVTEADLAPLPAPAQRYLRWAGVVGRPRDRSFRLHLRGRFKMSEESAWQPADAWQYNSRVGGAARLFYMTLPFKGIPVYGRDTYLRGRGRMLVRPLDLFTVADYRGPELDEAELVTYLDDAVLLAPSMLLVPEVRWTAVDDSSFDVAMRDAGREVSARVLVAGTGAVRDFVTRNRYFEDSSRKPTRFFRATWRTPVAGWTEHAGRRVLTRVEAIWRLPHGEFTYADFTLDAREIEFNADPGT